MYISIEQDRIIDLERIFDCRKQVIKSLRTLQYSIRFVNHDNVNTIWIYESETIRDQEFYHIMEYFNKRKALNDR